MLEPFVLPLSRCTDLRLVGGKAVGLARLVSAGFPVPQGCCVTTRAYRHALETIGFDAKARWRRALSQPPENRRQELRQCSELIRRCELSPLLESLRDELGHIGLVMDRQWAVRSSATNEDMARASSAGVYRTRLGVPWDELGPAITDTWASVWDERVMGYMVKAGSAKLPPAMAVVIQPLLDATLAGVATSIDPLTGQDRHVAINAIRGLGQPLVDGTVMPDQYLVETKDAHPVRMIRRRPGHQPQRLVARVGGLVLETMAPAERREVLMSDEEVFTVAALTKRIEQAFEAPVDVEWAIDGERLWVLQARPLTGMRPTSQPTNDDSEWSRANFKETMPEVPSPLGLSFLEHFMEAYIVSHYRRLGCRIPPGLSAVRIYAGRPYLNVTLFHLLVEQLGGDPALNAEQMGGAPIQSAPSVQRLGWPALVRAGWLMWGEMRRVSRDSAGYFAEMKQLASRYSDQAVRSLSLEEAGASLDELGRWLERREMTFGIAAGAGQCLQAFSRLLPRWLGADWRQLLNESLQGQGTVISAHQIVRMAELAALARNDTVVSEMFRRGWKPGDYRRHLNGTAFLSAFDRYLEDYGHRALAESDIMSLRVADEPEALLELIKTQLHGSSKTAEEVIRRQQTGRDRALSTIRARCGPRLDRWLVFRWWYRRLSRFFALREANRHHLMWYSLAARRLLLRIGELLVIRGVFSCREDIFFLTLREREALEHTPADRLASLTKARRKDREECIGVHVPDVLRGWELPQDATHSSSWDPEGPLSGLPVSSGVVNGHVRFVRSLSDWSRVQSGDIIVAPVIDPGMAPLFSIAAGVIVEMGGTLSHGAIIAREYGLPVITNVLGATSRLSEGERVTLDAVEGVIRREGVVSGP